MVKKTEKPAKTTKPAKPAKPAAKKSTKVFDVSKPGKGSAPSATARPVIVTHRPIMQDPMVSSADASAPADGAQEPALSSLPNPSATKIVIQPLSETDKAETPKTDTIDLKIPDFGLRDSPKQHVDTDADGTIDVTVAKTAPDVPDKAADKTADDKKDKPADKTEGPSAEPAEPATAGTETAATDQPDTPAEEPSEPAVSKIVDTAPESSEPAPAEPASLSPDADTPVDESAVVDKTKEEKETAALEAEIKRQEELDKIVESKEYFLPITTAEHRRSKLVTIFGIILIILLGLLLVNMLLDVGTIRIKGVEPLTHFFGSEVITQSY